VSPTRQDGDFYGYNFVLATPQSAYGYDLTQAGRVVAAAVGVHGIDIPLGGALQLQVLTGLSYWNGTGKPRFSPVSGQTEVNLRVNGQDLRIGATTDQVPGPAGGRIRRVIDVAVSNGTPLDRTIETTIGTGGAENRFAFQGATAGVYAFTAVWSVRDSRAIRDSAPVTFVLAAGGISQTKKDAATAYFSAAATLPTAIASVFSQPDAEPDGPGRQSFLRVNLQFSQPVSVSGRSPGLPVSFDGVWRTMTLEQFTPTRNVTTLTFSYIPTQRERSASVIQLGNSLSVSPGSSLISAAGTPSTLSLPLSPTAARLSLKLQQLLTIIDTNITRDTTLRKGTKYIIDNEVHVRAGVTLTIENGVTVLIRNGYRNNTLIDTNALVFDSGSRLRAKTVSFGAANDQNQQVPYPNNGGVYFCGTYRASEQDGISTTPSEFRSSFQADLIVASYLGRPDPYGGDGDDNTRDDIDCINVMGMGPAEWHVLAVQTDHSGDDGFDVTDSSIAMDRLTVAIPIEDGLNVTSSFVQIRKSLNIVMSTTHAKDRELFDLEVDDGPTHVVIDRYAAVNLQGYWGNVFDEVDLNSLDMPACPRSIGPSVWYAYTGWLRKGPATVYSINAD